MRCERPRCAAAQRVLRPTNEYEYDGVWNEACATVLSVFPITTGALPHQFHPYINQQDSVLVLGQTPFHHVVGGVALVRRDHLHEDELGFLGDDRAS